MTARTVFFSVLTNRQSTVFLCRLPVELCLFLALLFYLLIILINRWVAKSAHVSDAYLFFLRSKRIDLCEEANDRIIFICVTEREKDL